LPPRLPTVEEHGDDNACQAAQEESDKDGTRKWRYSAGHIEKIGRNARCGNERDHICLLLREYRVWRVSLLVRKKQASGNY